MVEIARRKGDLISCNCLKYICRCWQVMTGCPLPVKCPFGPGGNISAIVYAEFLDVSGWPRMQGVSWDIYFTEAYYRKEVPVWRSYAPVLFDDAGLDMRLLLRVLGLALALGMLTALSVNALYRRATRRR